MSCPICSSEERQVRAGFSRAGSQRYLCRGCGRTYTPQPRQAGQEQSVKERALQIYAAGMSMREAARFVGVTHRTVANWVKAACARAEAGGAVEVLDAQVAARLAMGRLKRECRGPRRRRARRSIWLITF